MGAIREKWAEMCLADGLEVWKVGESGNHALFVTKRHIVQGENESMTGTSPMWQIWSGDNRLFAGASMREAYNKWNKLTGVVNHATD